MTRRKTNPRAVALARDLAPHVSTAKPVRGSLTQDGWVDTDAGIGIDRSGRGFAIDLPLRCLELQAIYDGDWLARKVVNLLPAQALRAGFKIADDESDTICKAFEALNFSQWNPTGALENGLQMGRLMGGGAILIGADSDPLSVLPDGKANIKWLDVVHRDEVYEVSKEKDANSPNFGRADVFRITGNHLRAGQSFHVSRMILCEGDPLAMRIPVVMPDGYRFPWVSTLAPLMSAIRDYGLSWSAVSTLLREMSIGVLKMKGLISALGADNTAAIEGRLDLLSAGKSIAKTIFLDADTDEEFTRVGVSFSDLASLFAEYAKVVSGATDIPTTILLGMAPAGLNATGQSDLQQWYDRVQVYRVRSVEPKLRRLLGLIAGRDVEIEWPSLWEPTELVKAQTNAARASVLNTLYTIGAIDGKDVRDAPDLVEDLAGFEPVGDLPDEPPLTAPGDNPDDPNADPNADPGAPGDPAQAPGAKGPRPASAPGGRKTTPRTARKPAR